MRQQPLDSRRADDRAGKARSSCSDLGRGRGFARRGPRRCLSGMLAVLGVLGGWLGSRAASGASATALAGGAEHTCALTSRGTVQCWGRNRYGQLGDGTTTDRWTPVTVAGLGSGILAVSAGEDHTCALTSGGAVRCWGHNGYGQLGDGTTTDRWTPATASGLGSGVLALSVGWSHTCAVTSAGAVRCWGRNDYGQLGDGTTTNRSAPVAVSGLGSGIAAVTAGAVPHVRGDERRGRPVLGVQRHGPARGRNHHRLSDDGRRDRAHERCVGGGDGPVPHLCADDGGAVRCWGDNNYGQLGDGTTTTRTTWVAVSGLASGVTALTAGWSHTCALSLAGVAQCWGYNYFGQIGDGTTANRTTPVTVTGLTSAVGAVAAGGYPRLRHHEQWSRAVLGAQLLRATRRRNDDRAVDTGDGDGPGGRRGHAVGRGGSHLWADE